MNLSKNELAILLKALADRMSALKMSAARSDRVGDITKKQFAEVERLSVEIKKHLDELKAKK